jgi:hypothetical protein
MDDETLPVEIELAFERYHNHEQRVIRNQGYGDVHWFPNTTRKRPPPT